MVCNSCGHTTIPCTPPSEVSGQDTDQIPFFVLENHQDIVDCPLIPNLFYLCIPLHQIQYSISIWKYGKTSIFIQHGLCSVILLSKINLCCQILCFILIIPVSTRSAMRGHDSGTLSITRQNMSFTRSHISISLAVVRTQVPAPDRSEGRMARSHSSYAAIIPPMVCILKSSINYLTLNIAPFIFPVRSAIVAAPEWSLCVPLLEVLIFETPPTPPTPMGSTIYKFTLSKSQQGPTPMDSHGLHHFILDYLMPLQSPPSMDSYGLQLI